MCISHIVADGLDEFPMTVTGKIRKVQMREESVELLSSHGAAATSDA